MKVEDLRADAQLDTEIQFPHPLVDNWQTPQAVFLTGSTGFLGAYLLVELLQQTNADIYCLVRADDAATGKVRIQQRLQFYQLWQAAFMPRIVPVVGDLSLPRLGLSEQAFAGLTERIDVIYHNGAEVNAASPYARLRISNVLGTVEILRLAGLIRTKPVNFVSTAAVFFSDAYVDQDILESDFPSLDTGLKGGYKQSKWVAECLIQTARKRGLPSIIHRPTRILADSQTGIIDRLGDLLGVLLQGCLQLGQFPQVDSRINFTPVDYVSQAIVYLGKQESALNRNFHVCSPESIDWLDLWKIINELGYEAKASGFQSWTDAINRQAQRQHDKPLYRVLRYLLRSPIYLFAPKPEFNTHHIQKALSETGIACPSIDSKLMATYLSYFQRNGNLLPVQRDVLSE